MQDDFLWKVITKLKCHGHTLVHNVQKLHIMFKLSSKMLNTTSFYLIFCVVDGKSCLITICRII